MHFRPNLASINLKEGGYPTKVGRLVLRASPFLTIAGTIFYFLGKMVK